MHAYLRRGLYGTLTAGGFLLLGAVGAVADTNGDNGAASGTQVVAPASAPASADGNAVSVLGRSSTTKGSSNSAPDESSSSAGGSDTATSGTRSVGSGTQVAAPVNAPVSAEGNAISVLGRSSTTGTPAGNGSTSAAGDRGSDIASPAAATSGMRGLGSGMQAITPLNAPVSAEGNAVSVLGGSSTAGSTAGTSGAGAPGNAGSQDGSPDATASGTRGLGSGTQSGALVGAVVSAEGGSGTALGDARTTSGSADATPTGGTPARAIGSGADAAEGRHGTAANSCAEKISLSSASGPGPATAGLGSADLGSTAFSAVLFMLLGASLASVLRRKRSTAGNA